MSAARDVETIRTFLDLVFHNWLDCSCSGDSGGAHEADCPVTRWENAENAVERLAEIFVEDS